MSQIHDNHVTARYGYRVPGNRRAAFIGCGEKTAKAEWIVKPAAIQVRSPVGSLNVGTMGGKGVEVVEIMERRRGEMLCLQESKWRGDRARRMVGGPIFYMWVEMDEVVESAL